MIRQRQVVGRLFLCSSAITGRLLSDRDSAGLSLSGRATRVDWLWLFVCVGLSSCVSVCHRCFSTLTKHSIHLCICKLFAATTGCKGAQSIAVPLQQLLCFPPGAGLHVVVVLHQLVKCLIQAAIHVCPYCLVLKPVAN